jgi:putative transposase
VENNPVKAGLTLDPAQWKWSSAQAHISGRPDGLTDISAIGRHVANWRAMLADGLEAADRVDQSLSSGLPLADAQWIADRQLQFKQLLVRPKIGRPPKK